MLQDVADRVARNVRGGERAARYGGEEFGVIMPETGTDQAEIIAERLREAIAEEPFTISGSDDKLEITVSIGLACCDSSTKTSSEILEKADQALYRAKDQGRNKVVVAA